MKPGRRGTARALRWRDETLIVAGLAALALLLATGGWAWRLDRLLYDGALAWWRRPPPPEIVIVAIDDASVEAIGRWPWSRAVQATLLERLAEARPRAVLLDLVLSEPDPDPRQDALLARVLAAGPPVVMPVPLRATIGMAMAPLEPVEPLRSAVRLGMAEPTVDADGVLRSVFLHAGVGEVTYPHLALALLEAGGESVHPDVRAETAGRPRDTLPGWRDERLLIRYAGPPGWVERISYLDVLRGAVAPERLAGRYVLIGMTAQGLGDTLATPVNALHQAMPGIEVHANLLRTLRSGDGIDTVPQARVGIASAAALALLVLAFARFGPRVALPLALVSVPLAAVASALSLNAGQWWSPVPYALPALLAYPLWSWRRLERAMAGLDVEIERLAQASSEPATERAHAGGRDVETRLATLRHAGDVVTDARRFLAEVMAAMPTAVLVADHAGRVTLANPQAAALFEVESPDELQGLDLVRLLGEFRTAASVDWADVLTGTQAGQAAVAVPAQMPPAGDYVLQVAPLERAGPRRWVVTAADIAPVRQAQRQREEVLAFVSHDLRSPASAIVMLADLNLSGAVTTPHDDLLREVRRLAARTLAMSEDFVRTAQAQTRPLARQDIPLTQLVEEGLADHRTQALAAGVPLEVASIDPAAVVCIDRSLASRALGNLVSNGLKHSPPGVPVRVQARVQDDGLHLVVTDGGPGLSPEQLQHLARGSEGAPVASVRGVGLGLLFVQRVARRHGGWLEAGAASPGPGARFELVLGLRAEADSGNP